MLRRAIRPLLVVLLVGLAGCSGVGPTAPTATATDAPGTAATATSAPVSTPGSDYDTATVVLLDANGTAVATVDVWVADTFSKQYTGLSDTSALEPGQGMLFVFDSEGDRAFVMRDMAFPLDMVFIGADGTITAIHHAPVESDGDLTQYSGRAKFVLEVPMGYTNRTGIDVGDRVRIEGR
ncbi:DUF192 domain-containing protein [Haloplanus natans]|uniref:DUF192 domain-containing protein n=1 Tax=Haloplanus natans TaxID=376171 RepID=UPI000678070B|nr:DUF192 domain-containing protein [Haloplanus natans]